MPELTQSDYEALEVAAQNARQRFLTKLSASPTAFAAYQAWREAENRLFEAKRARRSSEVHD